MRPTDIARATIIFAFALTGHCQIDPSPFRSVTCTPKTGADLERQFCAYITREMPLHKPGKFAPNRTLGKTEVEFSARADGSHITLSSVLVKDPTGKNTVEVVFTPPADFMPAAAITIENLRRVLIVPATVKSVHWIVGATAERAPDK